MSKVLHAPDCTINGEAYPTTEAVCGTRAMNPRIALSGQHVTCQACIAKLRKDKPQWLNQLHVMGWGVSVRIRLRKGRKADPRQTDFADLFMEAE